MEYSQLSAIVAVFIISLISLIGVVTISLNEKFLKTHLFLLVSLAVGALFGDALIHLIPHALEELPGEIVVPFFVLLGIVLFFSLEKFIRWKSHRNSTEKLNGVHGILPAGPLILVGDALHNILDGIIIGAGFLVSTEVGIATTIAIALHEIPQEIGDFGILLHSGYSRTKALLFNLISALFAFLGLGAVFIAADVDGIIPAISATAAGGFIYIAGSNLVPELHRHPKAGQSIQQLFAILLGIGLMFLLLLLEADHEKHVRVGDMITTDLRYIKDLSHCPA